MSEPFDMDRWMAERAQEESDLRVIAEVMEGGPPYFVRYTIPDRLMIPWNGYQPRCTRLQCSGLQESEIPERWAKYYPGSQIVSITSRWSVPQEVWTALFEEQERLDPELRRQREREREWMEEHQREWMEEHLKKFNFKDSIRFDLDE